ncbi:hypothetical protein [Mucilaginibacter sp. UR6-11]|uniref:hypothetical protein n=1 Tax=Mucilaginibacter sp. UR6-11 TaxID=1435644 RepID=UPI001E55A407|nr:hypothetical protein [Mucilaginibacter sp. UR6-11]MCC8426720.1 hypothetical protein [Mucilaginibacter sp. UR6-11]
MAAFYFNISSELPLMVVPETRVSMDGHPILTHSYSLYRNTNGDNADAVLSPDDQQRQSNPNYLGSITFEIPGRVFNYIADGQASLSRDELEQAIEQISHYRDHPDLWPQSDNV